MADEPQAGTEEGAGDAAPASVERLLTIPMPIAVMIARKEMLLDDVLNLSPGSVVEFDTHHKDLFHLMVAGKTIARGEAVIMNEKFGLRIVEIGSPRDTLSKVSGQIRS